MSAKKAYELAKNLDILVIAPILKGVLLNDPNKYYKNIKNCLKTPLSMDLIIQHNLLQLSQYRLNAYTYLNLFLQNENVESLILAVDSLEWCCCSYYIVAQEYLHSKNIVPLFLEDLLRKSGGGIIEEARALSRGLRKSIMTNARRKYEKLSRKADLLILNYSGGNIFDL